MTRFAFLLLCLLVLLPASALLTHAQVAEQDSLALVTLYNTTDGPNWIGDANWLVGPVASWDGVTVDSGRVTVLLLQANALDGEIPPEIGDLTKLQRLRLFRNRLSGTIPPELGNLANLTDLALARNQFVGALPPELGNLANLKTLDLAFNQFTGLLAPEPGDLLNLEVIFLNDNQFSGPIPPQLGNLAAAQTLNLSRNQLTGAIPPQLGSLDSLTVLDLSFNQLDGAIPPEIGDLAGLQVLWLLANSLTGPIPPEIGNLANLTSLLINNTQLTGSLPLNFTNLTSLNTFNFTNTDLCEPADAAFQTWLQNVGNVSSTGVTCTATATDDAPVLPTVFALDPGYPNPFNTATRIRYALPRATPVRLSIYDAAGRLVAVPVDAVQPAGWHGVTVEAGVWPSGVYFYHLEAGTFRATRSLLLLR